MSVCVSGSTGMVYIPACINLHTCSEAGKLRAQCTLAKRLVAISNSRHTDCGSTYISCANVGTC